MIAQATLKDIQADTVLAEFKTDKNKLSVWAIENEDDLDDAFIALGSNCQSLTTISAVKIDEVNLIDLSLEFEEGDTPTYGINSKHRNIVELNYVTLGNVINSIIWSIRDDNYVRKTKGQMTELLVKAYKANKLDMDRIASSVKDSIMRNV